ncbi:hypothetical protein LEP1GSC073_2717 [Leptospira noguchii str. Cascata]|nr:hypothetical protein LEP1GSC073_2717 [Leptospira noguchii str. Cascata]
MTSDLRKNIIKPIIGYSDDGSTTTKNRFHGNKAASGKSGFRRIRQTNSNGLYPIFRGSEKRKCGSACKNEWYSSRNNINNHNRYRQLILDGSITYFVRNNSENSNVLKINTLVLDNILNIKTLSHHVKNGRDKMTFVKATKGPIIEKANVLKKESVSGSDYSQVERVLGFGRIGQDDSDRFYSRIRKRKTWKCIASCERDGNRRICNFSSSHRKTSSPLYGEDRRSFNGSQKTAKITLISIDKTANLTLLSLRNSKLNFGGEGR